MVVNMESMVLGWACVFSLFVVMAAIATHEGIKRKKRRESVIEKLSNHPDVGIIIEYNKMYVRMKEILHVMGDTDIETASRGTVVGLFSEAMAKKTLIVKKSE